MAIHRYFDPEKPGRLGIDKSLYARLAEALDQRTLVRQLVIPVRSGLAWPVRRGQMCRIVTIEGPQIGDFNCWSLHNPRERFWNGRSRQINGAHITTYSRLWSTLPYLRPMLTFTNDTVPRSRTGARCHDLLGTRCDPYMYKLVHGVEFDKTCHSLLTRAIKPFGLTELDVHDVVNLFQVSLLDPTDEIPIGEPSPARKGDFVEFFAEIDLLCAVSTCYAGDFSVPGLGGGFVGSGPDAALPTCKPLGIEVYDVHPSLVQGWSSPEPAQISSV